VFSLYDAGNLIVSFTTITTFLGAPRLSAVDQSRSFVQGSNLISVRAFRRGLSFSFLTLPTTLRPHRDPRSRTVRPARNTATRLTPPSPPIPPAGSTTKSSSTNGSRYPKSRTYLTIIEPSLIPLSSPYLLRARSGPPSDQPSSSTCQSKCPPCCTTVIRSVTFQSCTVSPS